MNKRVLFIDDDERILAGFRRNLHGHFEVDVAVGPEAGLAKVRDNPPYAVVVSDLRMPGIDGLETARRIKTDPGLGSMPAVLMVTAFKHETVLKTAEELGLPILDETQFHRLLDTGEPGEPATRAGAGAADTTQPELAD